MKKNTYLMLNLKFRYFLPVLLFLFISRFTAAANNNFLASSMSMQHSVPYNYLLQDGIKYKNRLFNNVTIQITNYSGREVEIYFYNQDTCYYIDAYANGLDFEITIPEGEYDVVMEGGSVSQNGSRTVWLGYYQNGYQNGYNLFRYDGVYLDSNNKNIYIES